ncbi:MAG TPA: class I SAM-dependent methyltransferase, partial [Phenylobacterium sp.]|nr:class I SAM-dependent methyltransferase [Phenylobacterium sp.]
MKTVTRQLIASVLKDRVAAWTQPPPVDELFEILNLIARWRSRALASTYVSREGAKILQGPFAGMAYVDEATEGALMPRLLGTYESELHPHFDAICPEVDCIIDVGCAEGYYAVGLARRWPALTVHARDILETARRACADLAARNDVGDRVIVGGEFHPEDFQDFADRRVLVLVDAEGAEVDILQPARGPALAQMNIIVETHDAMRPGALETLRARFAATHDIVKVEQQPKTFAQPWWLQELSHLDQLLSVWEWRYTPTP